MRDAVGARFSNLILFIRYISYSRIGRASI